MKRIAVAAILVLAAAPLPAGAQTVLTFMSEAGFHPGDASRTETAEGVNVTLNVVTSPNNGQMYVKADFCDANAGGGRYGVRVTLKSPKDALSMVRVPAGGCGRWSEHLTLGAGTIYVFVDKQNS